jgi:Fic-DOC domain mobile mystery protein B
MTGDHPDGATPLTPEEEDGLIPSHITLRSELNAYEQDNILSARTWLVGKRVPAVAESRFLKELHRRMFDATWKWAGKYRQSDRNIGVPWTRISFEVEQLCREVEAWREELLFGPDELAVRFHHKLVWIHCFPNGNGRHARLATDLLVTEVKGQPFSWGKGDLYRAGSSRQRYIEALREADQGRFQLLLEFVRS